MLACLSMLACCLLVCFFSGPAFFSIAGCAGLALQRAQCSRLYSFVFFFIFIWCFECIKDVILLNAVPDPHDRTLVQPIVKLFRHWASRTGHQSSTTMY